MNWAKPIFLNFLYLVPLVITLVIYRRGRNKKIIKSIADVTMRDVIWKENKKKSLWKEILLILSLTFLILSMARPRWGRILSITQAEGYNVVFALDASSSMLAQDVKGGRINKAKESIKAALGQLPGSRFGLVAFSGKAYKLCPLTTDVNSFKLFVDLVEPSLIPTEGTDIGAAVRKSMELFSEKFAHGSRFRDTVWKAGVGLWIGVKRRRAGDETIRICGAGFSNFAMFFVFKIRDGEFRAVVKRSADADCFSGHLRSGFTDNLDQAF